MKIVWDDKTNNEILLRIKQLEAEHEMMKRKLIEGCDKLFAIEDEAAHAIKEINKRLK